MVYLCNMTTLILYFLTNVKPTWKEVIFCPLVKPAYIKLPRNIFC